MCRQLRRCKPGSLLLIVLLPACGPAANPVSTASAIVGPTGTGRPRPSETPAYNFAFELTPSFESHVDVGDASLYLVCFGLGTPAVVLDSGAGMTPDTWKDVVNGIYQQTRTCAFNRAGYGWSSGPVEPRSAQTQAEMLHTLLAVASIEGPYILVGHSIAALSDIVFADQYAKDTAGLVLVDGSHPDQCTRRHDALPPESPEDSEDLRAFRSIFVNCDTFWSRITSENGDRWLDSSAGQVRAVTTLRELPLIVLANGSTTGERGDIPPELIAELDRTKVELQREYAALSAHGSLVLVEDTTHLIQKDQPQVVIEAILQVLETARGR